MIMDKVTEFVAHFIGVLHIASEEERLRDAFEKFKALRAMDPEAGALLNVTVVVSSPYALEGFTPGIDYEPPAPLPAEGVAVAYYPFPLMVDLPFFSFSDPLDQPMNVPVKFQIGPGAPDPVLTLDVPSSAITVTYQTASLSDNDILRLGDSVEFISSDVLLATLNQWALIADVINGPGIGVFTLQDGGAHGYALALMQEAAATDGSSLSGVSVSVAHGTDVIGHHENGESVDAPVALDDVMPMHLRPEDPAEDGDQTAEQAFLPKDPSLEFYNVDPGHNVVSGGNTAVNEAFVTTAWLDAPVIAVMGDAISLDIIVQTNVLIEHDSLSGTGSAAVALGNGTSSAYNSASFLYASSRPDAAQDTAGADDAETQGAMDTQSDGATDLDPETGLPSSWVVARLEADLTLVNWVHQYTFATDTDQAEVVFSGWETFIGLGENLIVNAASLLEIGYGYDLIIVGGHMISVNMITQTNVLLDSDMVTYDGAWPVYTSGADNLLYNSATISSVGLDQHGAMTGNFAAAGEELANGATTISRDAAQDPIFEGTSLLKVLYIDGDFTTLNLVEQTNIFGDDDQVHMALKDFQNVTGGDVTLTTGSNALINTASISDFGVDSNILVAGEVYEDALLYQAELIDTDANPLGVGVSDLVNEAVVYLADNMLVDETPDSEIAAPVIEDGSTSPDVMQTMLA
ncbi:type I secretion protein ATPase [Sulfitobacter sabulilitoris]|uniref:Type I secretion protein ATPase n=1 Tax=Sulfitobacter sabulilitoris TaxID=2562655 RepID=A0A5S3QCE6_9RHOB|nr:type I secretion protein ATPase [Sulfitobacter sabulilitoris]TMM54782.1 type I secretion protein ATPase [Sulfitobacter sabulilitoris]